MAAIPDPFARGPELVDIQRIGARDLDPLLREETAEWHRELDWDFSESADLVRKFADQRALSGAALVYGGREVVGYGYAIIEDHKGLIGDVYVSPRWRRGDTELQLFRTLTDSLSLMAGVRRIESQLMLPDRRILQTLQRERFLKLYERSLLRIDAAAKLPAARTPVPFRYQIEPWGDHHYDSAATVISLSYIGHVDSNINDQYQTFAGARRFIYNVVQFPGCGSFCRAASFIATDRVTGGAAGMVLCSFVGHGVGHITQLCVTPQSKGVGLGYELLRRGAEGLRAAGAKRITLTVTTSNTEAIRLYEGVGFQEMRRFYASVQEGY